MSNDIDYCKYPDVHWIIQEPLISEQESTSEHAIAPDILYDILRVWTTN